MGKLIMTTAGSVLGASVLVLTGAGIASAQPVSEQRLSAGRSDVVVHSVHVAVRGG
jgi:hypothetical protein